MDTTVITGITRGSIWLGVAFQFVFLLLVTVLVGIWLRSALSKKYTDENVKVIKAVKGLEIMITGLKDWMTKLDSKVDENAKNIVDVDKRVSLLEQLNPDLMRINIFLYP